MDQPRAGRCCCSERVLALLPPSCFDSERVQSWPKKEQKRKEKKKSLHFLRVPPHLSHERRQGGMCPVIIQPHDSKSKSGIEPIAPRDNKNDHLNSGISPIRGQKGSEVRSTDRHAGMQADTRTGGAKYRTNRLPHHPKSATQKTLPSPSACTVGRRNTSYGVSVNTGGSPSRIALLATAVGARTAITVKISYNQRELFRKIHTKKSARVPFISRPTPSPSLDASPAYRSSLSKTPTLVCFFSYSPG